MRQALRCRKAHVGIEYQYAAQQFDGIGWCCRKYFVKGNGRGVIPLQSSGAEGQRFVIGPVGLVGGTKDSEYFVELGNIGLISL